MEVKIKNLDAEMAVKSKGMDLEVKAPKGKSTLGVLSVKKSGLVWTKGKAAPVNISWKKFLELVEQMSAPKTPAVKKTAAKKTTKKAAAKKVAKKPAKKVAKKTTKKATKKKAAPKEPTTTA